MAKKPPETKTPETAPSAPQEVPPVAPDAVTEVQAPVMPPRDLEDENARLRAELEASRLELKRVDEGAAKAISDQAERYGREREELDAQLRDARAKNSELESQLADEQTKVAILQDTAKTAEKTPQEARQPLAEVLPLEQDDPRHLRRICGF